MTQEVLFPLLLTFFPSIPPSNYGFVAFLGLMIFQSSSMHCCKRWKLNILKKEKGRCLGLGFVCLYF